MRLAPILAVAVLLAGPPAQAHAILMASEPAAGATVPAGPAHLELRFNSRIDRRLSRVELRAPGHAPVGLALVPAADDRLVADMVLPPGGCVIRWQVLAVDGHITRGDIPLTAAAR